VLQSDPPDLPTKPVHGKDAEPGHAELSFWHFAPRKWEDTSIQTTAFRNFKGDFE